tara:strand:- start:64 stop:1398 length:1335 start_codon:yes stop_codon:yes gene_type:complete
MSNTYLVHRKQSYSYLFRSIIPKDLQPQLGNRQFQLSLNCGILGQAKSISRHLYNHAQCLYERMRKNGDEFQVSIDQIKDILRSELANLVQPISKLIENKTSEVSSIKEETEFTSSISLSELSTKFLNSKTEANYPEKTVNSYNDTHKLAIEVLGNVPIDSLTHEDGRDFVEVLKKLPVNRSKSYPTLTVKELLELKEVKTLSHKSILKHTERISTLFNWAIKQGYTNQNVFRGKLELIRKVEVVEKHFTKQELDLVLGNALKAESLTLNKPERYWVTMIASHSGARLNEICQLDVSDIQEHEGIWVINLTGDSRDKSIKTHAGNRLVPLHPKLLEFGFLNYVEQIRNDNHQKLFPNLKKRRSTGYGTMISHWFTKYLKKLGIKKKGKNFHSFRHTVVNRLTTKQVYEPFIKELIGHSHGSLTIDVYGGRKPLEVLLNECVIKV